MRVREWAALPLALALTCLGPSGCSHGRPEVADLGLELSALDDARFAWLEASCVDGALPLAQLGFERELFTRVRGQRVQMVFDTRLLRDGCDALLVWDALPDPERSSDAQAHWDFVGAARVVSPSGATCGVADLGKYGGSLTLVGDELEVVSFQSPWCRGFDARFRYRRVAPRPLTERDLLRRYVAFYNRRDLDALSELFSSSATLLEPFTRTTDGTIERHEGRDAVLSWHREAFASSSWSALRLKDIYTAGDDRTWVIDWDYMDSELATPVSGRNLFVLADGEIFLTEVQLTDVPKPRLEAPENGPQPAEATQASSAQAPEPPTATPASNADARAARP